MLETIVTREDVAATYPNGVEDLLNYEKAMWLSKKHSPCATAKILDLDKLRIYYWFNERGDSGKTSKPVSVKCVEYFEEKELLPMGAKNPHFREINILTAWLMWSGHMRIGEQVTFSTALPKTEYNGRKGKRLKTVEECLDNLQIPFEYRYRELRTLEHGYLSRLFYCMGVPDKSKQRRLPDFSYLDSCGMERKYEFAKVFFSTRLKGSQRYGYSIGMITSQRKKQATKHLYEAARLLNSVFSESVFLYRVKKREAYGSYVYFFPMAYISRNELNKIMDRHPDLMEFSR